MERRITELRRDLAAKGRKGWETGTKDGGLEAGSRRATRRLGRHSERSLKSPRGYHSIARRSLGWSGVCFDEFITTALAFLGS